MGLGRAVQGTAIGVKQPFLRTKPMTGPWIVRAIDLLGIVTCIIHNIVR